MKKIAIIEDDMAIRQMYRIKLESSSDDFEVITAENGAIGLELIKNNTPDLVLLDLKMPVMDGYQMLLEMQKDDRLKKLKVIVLTNSGLEGAPNNAKDLNIEGYIVKANETPSQVVQKIKQALHLC